MASFWVSIKCKKNFKIYFFAKGQKEKYIGEGGPSILSQKKKKTKVGYP
jgi:hypothetical protein